MVLARDGNDWCVRISPLLYSCGRADCVRCTQVWLHTSCHMQSVMHWTSPCASTPWIFFLKFWSTILTKIMTRVILKTLCGRSSNCHTDSGSSSGTCCADTVLSNRDALTDNSSHGLALMGATGLNVICMRKGNYRPYGSRSGSMKGKKLFRWAGTMIRWMIFWYTQSDGLPDFDSGEGGFHF